jgi:hypothetical protein
MVLLSKPGVGYDLIRESLRSGDLIFFKGTGVSNIISKIEHKVCGGRAGQYTHIGIVIMSNDFPIGSPYRLCGIDGVDYAIIPYIFESTQSGIGGDGSLDADGCTFLGCQLRKLDNVVRTYDSSPDTHMAVGKLKSTYTINKNQLYKCFLAYNGSRYQINILYLLAAAFKRLRWLRFKLLDMGLFCSQLVTKILIDCDVLSNTIDSRDVLPCDFIPRDDDKSQTFDTDNKIPVILDDVIEFTMWTYTPGIQLQLGYIETMV